MKPNKLAALAIIFFIPRPRPSKEEQAAATELARRSGARVVFRNANGATRSDEKPEACLAVAGAPIPAHYAAAFPLCDENGIQAAPEPPEGTEAAPEPVNALGLPEGHPDNREDLAAALTEAGVSFHPNTGTEKLAAFYRKEFVRE
jgi:hypothetical protein